LRQLAVGLRFLDKKRQKSLAQEHDEGWKEITEPGSSPKS
jgi:hypothetical protein